MSPKNISVSWYTSLDDNHPSTMPGQWLYSFISLLFVLNLLYIFYILYMLHTVYTVYIWYMVYVYIYMIRMLVICQKICGVTIEVWPYATSGLSFWHRKAAREPKGDTAPLENGVLGQLLESGKFAENAEGLQSGGFRNWSKHWKMLRFLQIKDAAFIEIVGNLGTL